MIKGARDLSLDIFKGLLVLLMTYCHVLQFFGDAVLFPLNNRLETAANLLVFPGFVFAFGAAAEMAYYRRAFRTALPRMLVAAGKALGAFYLSGMAFRVVREGKPFAAGTIRRVLLLQDLPGWSEFLAAFFGIALMAILLYAPLNAARERPWLLMPPGLGMLALCLIPYESVRHPLLGLLAGTTAHASFPILQYMPYFLLGVFYVRRLGKGWLLPALAAALSLGGLARSLWLGNLPERFPPDFGWVMLPALGLAGLMLFARLAEWSSASLPLVRVPGRALACLGQNSLYYLLAGNLSIFALAGRGAVPQLKFRGWGLFGQPIAGPWGAFLWTLTLLAASAFVAALVRRGTRKAPRERGASAAGETSAG